MSSKSKKDLKKEMKKEIKKDETSAVFRLKPDKRSNSAIIKFVGRLNVNEKLGDEVIELDKPIHPDACIVGRHAIPIKNIDNFEMTGRLFKCNIVGSHIVASYRYPLMYLNVHYDKSMVSGSLFQIFVSININPEEKKAIKNNKDYVNLHFTGTWHMHIDCDDEFVENYERYLRDMLESEATTKFFRSDKNKYVELRKLYSDSDDMIADWVDNYIENKRKFYDGLMKEHNIEFKSMTQTRDDFVNMCMSNKFYKFLTLAMKCREIHRRKQYNLEDNTPFVVPKKIVRLNDIAKQLLDDGDLILDE